MLQLVVKYSRVKRPLGGVMKAGPNSEAAREKYKRI